MTHHACDLCGTDTPLDIGLPETDAIGVCSTCGFVYVPERRSVAEIAKAWDELYASGAYDPNWPGVKARLWYVAEWLAQLDGKGEWWSRKNVLDVGAGTGFFLDEARRRGAYPVGLEPRLANVGMVKSRDISCFSGSVTADKPLYGKHHVITLLWTLENCGDCMEMLRFAANSLLQGGHVVVATGSRILVPYKKRFRDYMTGETPPDMHASRWSCNSLAEAGRRAGMRVVRENDWVNNEWLVVCFEKGEADPFAFEHDDPQAVVEYFRRWSVQWP